MSLAGREWLIVLICQEVDSYPHQPTLQLDCWLATYSLTILALSDNVVYYTFSTGNWKFEHQTVRYLIAWVRCKMEQILLSDGH